ncbi:MAG: hypothetical protein RI907_1577 [Pseudomonadota bacterium]|jgi:hypothetical protein
MAPWSSSASEALSRPEGASRLQPTGAWPLRLGLLAGCPWPRAVKGLGLLPFVLGLFWGLTWLRDPDGGMSLRHGAMAALMVVAGLALAGWCLRLWGETTPAKLSWWGPWPGELSCPLQDQAPPDGRSRPEGFTVADSPCQPEVRLRWGPHWCVSWGPQSSHWAWIHLRDHEADRALKVLLSIGAGVKRELPRESASANAPSGEGRGAMASCEAWTEAARQRRVTQSVANGHHAAKSASKVDWEDTFPATEWMEAEPGAALDAGRTHGPAGRRPGR